MRRLSLILALLLACGSADAEVLRNVRSVRNHVAPTAPTSDGSDRIANTQWVNNFFAQGLPLAQGKIFIGNASNVATPQTPSGDCTLSAAGVITCTINASNISSGTLAAARGGAGTISGALKGNGSGVVSQAACGDLSNATVYCSATQGQLPGVTSNTSASSGNIGEYASSIITQGSPVSLS